MHFKRYLRSFVILTLLGLGGLAVLNLWVDPFDSFRLVGAKQLAPYRNVSATRIAKANRLKSGKWDVLILGSSREETGFDPTAPPLSELGRAYNAGLPGGNMYEARKVFEFVSHRQPPRIVILGVSLVMFGSNRTAVDDFDRSLFNMDGITAQSQADNLFRMLFGYRTTLQSIKVLQAAARGDTTLERQLGHRPTFAASGHPRVLTEELLLYYMSSPDAYREWQFSEARLADFRYVVQKCLEQKIELLVVFPPVHALQLEAIQVAGLWTKLEELKRELTNVVSVESDRVSSSKEWVQVWDFSRFEGLTAEPFPPLTERDAQMIGYIETSHFRPRLGQACLWTILDQANRNQLIADLGLRGDLFGIQLSPDNIESHLSLLRRERDRFAEEHPNEIDWLKSLKRRSQSQQQQFTRP